MNQGSNVWSFPKGGIEPGEDIQKAAEREVEEETGITQLECVEELGSYERYRIGKGGVGEDIAAGLMKRTIFFFRTNQHALHPKDAQEIIDVRYVTLDEAYELLTHPKDKEFLKSVWSKIEE